MTIATAGSATAAGPSATLSSKAPGAAALVAAATSKGSVPVIITLNVPSVASAAAGTAAGDAALKASIKSVVDPFVAQTLGVKKPATAAAAAASDSVKSAASVDPNVANGVTTMPFVPLVAASVSAATLEKIAADPRVKSIVRDEINYAVLTESVPLIGGIPAAAAGATGSGRMVAVLDSGVQYSHPFVSPRVTNAACYSTTGSGYTTLCPNGQGTQIGGDAGINCAITGPTANADCRHGTHVAGIAAGNRVGGTPPRGVAPSATIYSIQVFSRPSSGRLGAFTSNIISALNRVYQERTTLGIVAVNMSLGGGRYTAACDSDPRASIINQLRAGGVATVIASGNDGYTNAVSAPGCITQAVTVGSSTKGDVISSFSNSSSMVDLIAPGSSIVSSIPTNSYASFNGTSMATPHVAGAFVALKSAVPSATISQIETALKQTGVSIVDNRSGGTITRPRIDIYRALLRLRNQPLPPSNDNFANAFTVVPSATAPTVRTGTNVSASLEPAEPRGSAAVQASVWWKFTATRNEPVLIKTANSAFDTTLGIYRGSSLTALTFITFNDDSGGTTSRVQFNTTAGTTYYVQVGGFNGSRGAITLTFDHPVPPNDNFASAQDIELSPGGFATTTGTNMFATLETGEPKFKAQVSKTVWYKFTGNSGGRFSLKTLGSNFDTTLALYTINQGTGLPALSLLGSSDDTPSGQTSQVVAIVGAGGTYYVQVGGYNGAAGSIVLRLAPFGPPNDLFAGATTLRGDVSHVDGSNVDASIDAGEILAIPQIRNTVWWRFEPTSTKDVELTTAGTSFDTTLAVMGTGGPKGLRIVAFNDDDGAELTSRVRFTAMLGEFYYIQVGTYNSLVGGPISLNFTDGATPLRAAAR